MKTIFFLLVATTSFAQNLSLTRNTSTGDNCGQGQPTTTITYQDVNLNGHKLTLRNVNLIINGNLNGPGEVENCGNPNQPTSTICVNGRIQNEADINNLTCTLSEPKFEFVPDNYNLHFIVYDINGRELQRGMTSENTFYELPKKQIVILKVENFKALKIYKQ